jgi:endo-1,4-beta-xylanase
MKNASPSTVSFNTVVFEANLAAVRLIAVRANPALKALLFAALVTLTPALHAEDAPLAAGQLKHGAPLAAGQQKFLGSTYSPAQAKDFASYWNKVTPENAGKWGSVEAVRGQMDWRALDDAYRFAREHRFFFHLHVLVWGEQQPEWLRALSTAEQRAAIEHWFDAVAARYPDADFVEVVNEPLHHPPSAKTKDGGGYIEALGGSGASGWDWIVEAFRLARARFPHAKLLLNDYSISKSDEDTRRYRAIVDLLHAKNLIDGIGLQEHAFETTPGVPMSVHRANLDQLAASGVPIYVTEMDIDGPTDAQQLRDYQRVFPVFWKHRAVQGITLWGFRPGLWRSKQGANLVREDGSERPALGWLHGYVRGVNGPGAGVTEPATDSQR